MRRSGAKPVVVKKYSNRRLYDTEESRYVTLEELAHKIRAGADVQVLDAKTNADLTAATLTQIIIEGREAARVLPVPLLTQLIRMDDEALAEFFGRTMSWALEVYNQSRQGAMAMAPYNPFAPMPFMASNAFARMFGSPMDAAPPPPPPPPPPPAPEEEEEDAREPELASKDEMAALRREIEALKAAIGGPAKKSRK